MAITLARRMTGSREIAHELAQEALLQAYLSLTYLRDANAFASWFYGIVLNVCRSHRRHRQRESFSLDALAGGLHFAALPFTDSGPSPQEIAEAQELHALMLNAVNALSAKNRDATLLFYYEQLSLHEIASLLGVSVTAVKGRLHKARTQLRTLLAPLYEMPVASQAKISTNVERKSKMIQVTIADVVVQEESGNRIVVLHDAVNQRIMPIWIGPFEADVITLHLLNRPMPRPLTHDLMISLLQAAGTTVTEVRVEALKGNTYYAVIKLHSGATSSEVDARPSDAIALAIRTNSPIFVATEVMEQAGYLIPPEFQHIPLRKGLQAAAERFDKAQQEAETKREEAAETETQAARQKLFAYLFDQQPA